LQSLIAWGHLIIAKRRVWEFHQRYKKNSQTISPSAQMQVTLTLTVSSNITGISNYFDIKMRGIEYLRGVYLSSGMSIRSQSEENKIDALKQIIRSWRLNPEKILTREALGQSHKTAIEPNQL